MLFGGVTPLKRDSLRILLLQLSRQRGSIPQSCSYTATYPPISKTRRKRHVGYCWRKKGELISNVYLLTPSQGRTRMGRQARTYLQQLWTDTGCRIDDRPKSMDGWDSWREWVREIRASNTPWCYIYIYIYIYHLRLTAQSPLTLPFTLHFS